MIAARAGIDVGDILRKINGEPISHRDEAYRIIFGSAIGDTIQFNIERDGKLFDADIILEEAPDQ